MRALISWCFYDLANTIFAMNMTSYHLGADDTMNA